jgi:HSP20 family molecular chaperone IbpA
MASIVEKQIIKGTKRFLDTIFTRPPVPQADVGIYERGAALHVEMYLPHLLPETLEVLASRWHVTVKGECKNNGDIFFKQVIRLPKKVEKEEVFAIHDHGMLEIILPLAS